MNRSSTFRILVADDEKSNLDVLIYILKNDYKLYIAKSGEAALEIANSVSPDLILLDALMPDMDGFEVLSELKASALTCNIPVIFITGLDSVQDEERGFFLGAVDYITKPFHPSIVKARVNTHLKIIKHLRTIERCGMLDALTEIPNRRGFDEKFAVEWARALREKAPISLLMIDADNFKKYNDTYGHPQGDVLLKLIAEVIVTTLKRKTDLAFRWGGEEFAVLLPNTVTEGAMIVAERIRKNIEMTPVPLDDKAATYITVSIGATSIVPTPEDNIKSFVTLADKALYKAKELGRNTVFKYTE